MVLSTIQQIEKLINKCLAVHDRLEGSLHDLSRTGDVQACKAARKSADRTLKELSKEVRPPHSFLQSSPQAGHILPKVAELMAKERKLQDKLMAKHWTVVDCYGKKVVGREVEKRIASQRKNIASLRQEVDDLLAFIIRIESGHSFLPRC